MGIFQVLHFARIKLCSPLHCCYVCCFSFSFQFINPSLLAWLNKTGSLSENELFSWIIKPKSKWNFIHSFIHNNFGDNFGRNKKTNHFYYCSTVPTNPNTKRPMFMKVYQIHFIQPFWFTRTLCFQKKFFGIEIDGNCMKAWLGPGIHKFNILSSSTTDIWTSKSVRSRFHQIPSLPGVLKKKERERKKRF